MSTLKLWNAMLIWLTHKTQLISLPGQYLRAIVPLEGFQPACSVQCDIYPSTGNKALFVFE